MKKYKVYLFDFDGTLFNTSPGLFYVFKKSFESVGINIKKEDVMWLSRVPLPESYTKLGGDPDPSKIKEFVRVIEETLDSDESISTTKHFPEGPQFFEKLKNRDFKVGIVTSNNVNHVKKILKYLNIPEDIFDVYVGSDVVKEIKPRPEPILKALELLGYSGNKDDVVYVGDSQNDCLAAMNAGVHTYLVDRGDAPETNAEKIKSLLELFD